MGILFKFVKGVLTPIRTAKKLKTMVQEAVAKTFRSRYLKRWKEINHRLEEITKTDPYGYQREGIRLIQKFDGRALLADEMGLGKTIQALLAASINESRLTVIVCPAHLKYNWEHEIKTHLGVMAEVFEGQKAHRLKGLNVGARKFIIINYDILPFWLEYIRELKPEWLIVDECQKLIHLNSLRTKATRALAEGIPCVIGISGTPIENSPIEFWPMLNILRPDVYNSYPGFGMNYCYAKKDYGKIRYVRGKNLPELNDELNQTVMIRRLKSDVLKDLPKKARHVVPMVCERMDEYWQATEDFAGWLNKFHPKRADSALRMERFTKGGYLKRLAAEIKMKSVLKWIEDFLESGNKLIAFGLHKKVIKTVHEHFPNSVYVDGTLSAKQKSQVFDQFNNDKKVPLIVANLDAAGTGWSCTSAADVAHIELAWKPTPHTQGEDRAHGIGRGVKDRRTNSWWLVAHDTIEEYLCEMIQTKQGILDGALNGREDGMSELDIFEQVCKHILTSKRRR